MIPKNFADITEADLQVLLDNSVKEGKSIEYKRELPGNSDSDKKEFLADVSSFANASGGDLIFGIDEDNGYPISINGLDINDLDQKILSLEATIRSGIEPRLPSLSFKEVPLSNGKTALVIRINKSWISPHRVTFKGHDKFYSRGANCKYPLSVDELRIAFNLSETITEKISNFRFDRIAKIVANELPVTLISDDSYIVSIHLIPITAFDRNQMLDIDQIDFCFQSLQPINWQSSLKTRYNLDGRIGYSVITNENEVFTYVQLFRNGIIEAVWKEIDWKKDNSKILYSDHIEKEIIKALQKYIDIYKKLDMGLPVFLFLTLTNTKGFSINIDPIYNAIHGVKEIDRNILILPEIIIEDYEISIEKMLKLCFDAMWNAGDFPGSPNYNEQGEWKPKR